MAKKISHISLAPRDVFTATITLYGADAAAAFELQEANDMSRSEVVSRLVVIGIAALNGTPIPEVTEDV